MSLRAHPLGSHLFEEPCRRNLTLDNHVRGDLIRHARGQIGKQKILKNAACAFHRGGVFLVPDRDYPVRGLPQQVRVAGFHREVGGEDNPFLVLFENAFAIVKFALGVIELA